ncbi:MAG: TIGR02444 family protein [Novosphingobium sp.]|nr:TIGR02444 family protein [Novosphingobium sp.]
MNMPATAADAFWRFSLEVYSRPQVAELCLALQDEHGFDVNLLLLCLWRAQEQGLTLSQVEIRALRAGAADLNENLVGPIRQARRWARSRIDDAPDPQAKAERCEFYANLKQIELRGERFVQVALLGCLRRQGAGGGAADVAARASLEGYRQVLAAPESTAAILAQLTVRALT